MKSKKIFLCLLLSLILAFSSSMSVFADGGGDYRRPSSITDATGFSDWSSWDKGMFFIDNFADCGIV